MYGDRDMSAASSSSSSLAGPAALPNYPNLTAKVATKFDISVTDPER